MVKKYGHFKQSEARFQKDLFIFGKGLGFRYSHQPDSRRHTTTGIPDVLWIHDELGIVFWSELKDYDGDVRQSQIKTIDTFRRAGQEVYLWYPSDWDDGTIEETFLRKIKEAQERVR